VRAPRGSVPRGSWIFLSTVVVGVCFVLMGRAKGLSCGRPPPSRSGCAFYSGHCSWCRVCADGAIAIPPFVSLSITMCPNPYSLSTSMGCELETRLAMPSFISCRCQNHGASAILPCVFSRILRCPYFLPSSPLSPSLSPSSSSLAAVFYMGSRGTEHMIGFLLYGTPPSMAM